MSTRRLRHVDTQNHLRFLTLSCFQRLDLLGTPALRDECVGMLDAARARHGFLLHAWIVMPNHVHLLIRPSGDDQSVSLLLRSIKQPMAQRVIRRWRELDAPVLARIIDSAGDHRFWQRGGGYDRNVFTEQEAREKVAYIEQNPVRAGLMGHPHEWAWSSASPQSKARRDPVRW
ncbi:MAG: transposase [Planctomycetota bacterium]